jgi:hypothetical protein
MSLEIPEAFGGAPSSRGKVPHERRINFGPIDATVSLNGRISRDADALAA